MKNILEYDKYLEINLNSPSTIFHRFYCNNTGLNKRKILRVESIIGRPYRRFYNFINKKIDEKLTPRT